MKEEGRTPKEVEHPLNNSKTYHSFIRMKFYFPIMPFTIFAFNYEK